MAFGWRAQTYRQALDLGPLGKADNYRGCGEHPLGAAPRSPEWLPTAGPGGQGPAPQVTPIR